LIRRLTINSLTLPIKRHALAIFCALTIALTFAATLVFNQQHILVTRQPEN